MFCPESETTKTRRRRGFAYSTTARREIGGQAAHLETDSDEMARLGQPLQRHHQEEQCSTGILRHRQAANESNLYPR